MAFIRTTLSAALKKAPGCRLTLHIACKREGATLHCICKGAPRPPLGEAKGEGAALYCIEPGARGCRFIFESQRGSLGNMSHA